MTTVDSSAPVRHLPLPGTYNVRDVGGYPTRDGGIVRWQRLFRSDALSEMDDAGVAELIRRGLRTVIDLREPAERDSAPDPFPGPVPEVLARPVFEGRLGSDDRPGLAAVYERMVDDFGPQLAAVVRDLARPGALPALVHCTAGKDRTGVVVALVLAIAGVDRDVIAADYALTGEYLGAGFIAAAQARLAGFGVPHQVRDDLLACPPDLILRTLDRITDAHGGVENYLRAHGATAGELTALRTALVETL
ncbi:tyrosine-protein phosphatase [Amycolatopsis rubida]|uniref:Protein-tyrosine phosphatase n=1 Tax=Amycolatopsis rubida TaxID=112413 RepID=A0A1I5SHI7_9PSEU|nr:tyrosine-protein phosphatase [Amycolatopsis rubida]SFP70183.1 protein-tyrosine phosphatase [Amycolatopsis rubida]